jgi:hypothetical protein
MDQFARRVQQIDVAGKELADRLPATAQSVATRASACR